MVMHAHAVARTVSTAAVPKRALECCIKYTQHQRDVSSRHLSLSIIEKRIHKLFRKRVARQ